MEGVLLAARAFLEPHWSALQRRKGGVVPEHPSEGMCRHSVLFLDRLLRAGGHDGWEMAFGHCEYALPAGTELRWARPGVLADMTRKVLYHDAGTLPHNDYVFDGARLWGAHMWLERGGLVLDLTADQFGRAWGLVPAGPEYVRRGGMDRRSLAGLVPVVRRWEAGEGYGALAEACAGSEPDVLDAVSRPAP